MILFGHDRAERNVMALHRCHGGSKKQQQHQEQLLLCRGKNTGAGKLVLNIPEQADRRGQAFLVSGKLCVLLRAQGLLIHDRATGRFAIKLGGKQIIDVGAGSLPFQFIQPCFDIDRGITGGRCQIGTQGEIVVPEQFTQLGHLAVDVFAGTGKNQKHQQSQYHQNRNAFEQVVLRMRGLCHR